MIKTTTKTVNECEVRDVDNAITLFSKEKDYKEKNFLKWDYECIAENEWSNYQQHSFTVEPEMPDTDKLNDIKGLGTGEILNWMCAEGKLPAGEYLVNCSW